MDALKCWEEVPVTEATSKILPGTWVFRQKRTPDCEIYKFKARYCVRGDLQEGDFNTFAPTVAWSTVRFFLDTFHNRRHSEFAIAENFEPKTTESDKNTALYATTSLTSESDGLFGSGLLF